MNCPLPLSIVKTMPTGQENITTANTTAEAIQQLQESHEAHIAKLKSLHAFEVVGLESSLKASQERYKEQEAVLEGLKDQVSVLRQSFEMIQERLKKVLLEQDDLIDLLHSIKVEEKSSLKESKSFPTHGKTMLELEELERAFGINSQNKTEASEKETKLSKYHHHCLKYLRKLQSSDPLQLSHLLELPFSTDKPFALSDSMLSGILSYTAADDSDFSSSVEARITRLLVWELMQSRREAYALVRAMIEGGLAPIEEFIEKAGGESSCIRIALRSSLETNQSASIFSLSSLLAKLM